MAYKNKTDELEYYKKYNILNKEKKQEYKKERYLKVKEYQKEWSRKKYLANKELYKNRAKLYGTKIKARYLLLKRDAQKRNYDMKLTFGEFEKIISTPCRYCDENIKKIGIDREDNNIGYIKTNSFPCCKNCNMMKRSLSLQEFLSHIKKIQTYQNLDALVTLII